jgi:hypothetical protein
VPDCRSCVRGLHRPYHLGPVCRVPSIHSEIRGQYISNTTSPSRSCGSLSLLGVGVLRLLCVVIWSVKSFLVQYFV